MAKRERCNTCGKVVSKYSRNECSECYQKRSALEKEKNREIARKGICPICGRKLQRNLSLTGWYQCSQLGSEVFRVDPSQPSCSFQFFI